jgi:hypothetical protein
MVEAMLGRYQRRCCLALGGWRLSCIFTALFPPSSA